MSAPIVVVGAGIAGITTALEAAEAGQEVVLVERDPSVGGRVLKNHQYFPKMCPPSCGMEINTRRLAKNPHVRVLVRTELAGAAQTAGGWRVTLHRRAEHVTTACTACGDCSRACPATVADPFNLGLGKVPAIRLPHVDAWPRRHVLDRAACPTGCRACADACPVPGAIDLDAPVLPAYEAVIEGVTHRVVWCKFCNKWHWHGAAEGHREAHCKDSASGYWRQGYNLAYAGEWKR